MTGEHDLIKRFFAPLCSCPDDFPAFGLLDDTALIPSCRGGDVLLTSDMLVADVHFFADDPPFDIAHKALAVNVSDIVAKGGLPDLYLLSLALPANLSSDWLEAFSSGLLQAQKRYDCELVGGDTVSTKGPLVISVTMLGDIEAGKMVRRNGAFPGDQVFVSGTIGDGTLGLLARSGELEKTGVKLPRQQHEHLLNRYLRPEPDLALSSLIYRYASASMDISDGLFGDFTKLCAASHVGGIIEAARVPLSDAAASVLAHQPDLLDNILTGGDDYEVLMTIRADRADKFEVEAENVTRIGLVVERVEGVKMLDSDGQPLELAQSAYDHFGDIES
ncbi:MAG: thiamine-phosphate kinase [bacterium]|nr:thiamine-phosphate kinase [bacterium]